MIHITLTFSTSTFCQMNKPQHNATSTTTSTLQLVRAKHNLAGTGCMHMAAHAVVVQQNKVTALMSSKKRPSSLSPPKSKRRPAWTVVQCPVRMEGRGTPGIRLLSGIWVQHLLRTLKECRDESNLFVVYSLPPNTRSREPTAVIVCPTLPEGRSPAKF